MDEAARARSAAREAIADVTPGPLHDVIDRRLREATMTPGVLVCLSARATGRDPAPEPLDRRAAGVQLIYDGLQLTRDLARQPPWEDPADSRVAAANGGVSPGGRRAVANVEILAADVLVARGFNRLARTEAAPTAVETVQAFGRDETDRANGRSTPELNGHTLEADVFELAVIAGATAGGAEPPAGARRFATALAGSIDEELPSAPELLSEPTTDALSDLFAERDPHPATPEPEHMWAPSSVTDP